MKKTALIGLSLYALPLIAFAQDLEPLKDLVRSIGSILALLIPILIALALVIFFWGLVMYIWAGGGDEAKKQGRNIMIAGLVSLFVMVSVYGIISLAQNALGIGSDTNIEVPKFPGN
jgi:hypothetical protein